MSSEAFVEGPNGVLAAWETQGQVRFARVESKTLKLAGAISAPGPAGGRKHPVLAVNARGEILLAWTEGTAWKRGGALAWQVFDAGGKPTADRGRVESGVPVWGLAAAAARPDGGFTLIH